MLAGQPPRFALVLWPDGVPGLPTWIHLERLEKAVADGALVIAREDAIVSEPMMPVHVLDTTPLHSNPRRRREKGGVP